MLSIQEGLFTSMWVSVNVSCFQNRHHKGFKKLKEATQAFLDQVIYKKLQFKIGYRKKKLNSFCNIHIASNKLKNSLKENYVMKPITKDLHAYSEISTKGLYYAHGK